MEYCFPKHLCLLKAMLKLNNANLALLNNNSPETETSTLKALTINTPSNILFISDARHAHFILSPVKTFTTSDTIGHTSVSIGHTSVSVLICVVGNVLLCLTYMVFTVGIIKRKTLSEQFRNQTLES